MSHTPGMGFTRQQVYFMLLVGMGSGVTTLGSSNYYAATGLSSFSLLNVYLKKLKSSIYKEWHRCIVHNGQKEEATQITP